MVESAGSHTLRRRLLALSALGAIAVALRLYHLGRESLWLDETASVWIASRPLRGVLAGELTNPPGYYLLLHWWMGVFGTTEVAIRWLSVLPSVAAVGLTYEIGRRLYDDRVGLLGAAFMAVTPYQIYYAQEARAFSLLLCFSLASTLSFHVALSRTGAAAVGPWTWYCVTTIAALHTHFHAVFVVAAQNAVFIVLWKEVRPRTREWILVQGATILAFSPWLLTMLQAASGGGQVRRYLPLKLPEAVVSFLVGDTLVPFDEAAVQDIRGTLLSHRHVIAAFVLGFGGYLVTALRAPGGRRYGRTFAWTMFVVPLLLPFVVSAKVVIFDRRYVIAASPFLYIVWASGVVYLHDAAVTRGRTALLGQVAGAALVCTVLGVSIHNYYFNARFGKEQWREAVAFIEASYRPEDLVVFDPDFLKVSYDYYSRVHVAALAVKDSAYDEAGPEWHAAVERIATHRRVWLVRSHSLTPGVLPKLERMFSREVHRHFPKAKGIDVYLLEY